MLPTNLKVALCALAALLFGYLTMTDMDHRLAVVLPAVWGLVTYHITRGPYRKRDDWYQILLFWMLITVVVLSWLLENSPAFLNAVTAVYNTILAASDLILGRDPLDPDTPGSGLFWLMEDLNEDYGEDFCDAISAILIAFIKMMSLLFSVILIIAWKLGDPSHLGTVKTEQLQNISVCTPVKQTAVLMRPYRTECEASIRWNAMRAREGRPPAHYFS